MHDFIRQYFGATSCDNLVNLSDYVRTPQTVVHCDGVVTQSSLFSTGLNYILNDFSFFCFIIYCICHQCNCCCFTCALGCGWKMTEFVQYARALTLACFFHPHVCQLTLYL